MPRPMRRMNPKTAASVTPTVTPFFEPEDALVGWEMMTVAAALGELLDVVVVVCALYVFQSEIFG